MKQVKLSSNRFSYIFFVLSAIILVLFVVEIRKAGACIREQSRIEENRRLCENQSQALADASDYLTGEVWHFVATGKKEHLENYWEEVNRRRNREQALEHLEELGLSDRERELIWKAKQESDGLIQGEAWAMRMTADSISMPMEEMPPELASVIYMKGEESLSAADKRQRAMDYIFGEDYKKVKSSIMGNISSFRELLKDRKNAELADTISESSQVLNGIRFLMLFLILLFVTELLLESFLVIRPFHSYEQALGEMGGGEFAPLKPQGARETRSFALAFNQIYSEWQEQKKRLEQERYRFRIALENTSDIVYEYEPETDLYTAYGTLESTKGEQKERVIPHFLSSYAVTVMGEAGVNGLRTLVNGTLYDSLEIQVKTSPEKKEYLWVRITGSPAYSQDGKVTRLIGKITNIQSEKEKEFALEDERNRDGLTGLYKRKSGLRMIQDAVRARTPEENATLMILDMDDFARLNDKNGSVFADAILQDVADILKANAGPGDIQTRSGGDEFQVLFSNCTKDRALERGNHILSEIAQLSDQSNDSFRIRASAGLCSTQDAGEYDELYRLAENTLKYIKEHGKGRLACYPDVSEPSRLPPAKAYFENSYYDRPEAVKEELPSFALNLLGKSHNLNDAIYLLLSRVGNVCGYDRVAVMEADSEYVSCRLLHQWTSRRVEQSPVQIQYTDKDTFAMLAASYDEEGICDRYVVSSPLELGSILHAAIWNYGSYAGCMSFETVNYHQWTEKERSLLGELTKIISSFILKARADAVSQAKTDFLSRMSHEIRTPMNAITGMTTIAKSVLKDPEKELDCLNKIEFANRHLINLINDILDMSRIESGKMELKCVPVDLMKLAENMEMLVKPQAQEKKITLVVENGYTGTRPVLADELRLNQILVNLLSNAVKFTQEGGRVELCMEPLHKEEKEDTETLLKFSVKDNGIGISAKAQKRIFHAFEQAGSDTVTNYGGTGLGLSIASRLVQLMGGSLEVESAPDKGSCFFFILRLPYALKEEAPSAASAKNRQPHFDPHGRRLLLAEDNPLNREIAQVILEGHGFIVETAADGKEAEECFRDHEAGYYEAVLMDIRMPVMDGMEATRRIRTMGKEDSRRIPIIAMTANAFDEDMKKSLENGMNGHLSKPIDVEKLLRMLVEQISEAER